MNSTSRDHVIGEKLLHYLPSRMKKYMGFILGTWLIMVKFTKLNMSEFWYLKSPEFKISQFANGQIAKFKFRWIFFNVGYRLCKLLGLWDEYVMYLLKPIVNTLPGKWAFWVIYSIIFIPTIHQKLKLKYDCSFRKPHGKVGEIKFCAKIDSSEWTSRTMKFLISRFCCKFLNHSPRMALFVNSV